MPARFLLAVLALLAAALPAAPAAAAPKKPFTMVVAPARVSAGVTIPTYTVTITNKTRTQQLGSADVTIPTAPASDFVVDSGPETTRGTVSLSGKLISLRNLAIPPDDGVDPPESVTVTLGVRMPCVSGSYAWGVEAKQSNDFSGVPGNSFAPVSGTLSTIVDGSCKLRFVDQPASAEKTAQIRADAFQPTSTHLVTAEAIDGSLAPQRLTWFTGTVDVRLVQTGPGTLSPSPASNAAVAGLASFPSLTINASGNYNLRATTTSPGFSAGDSASFQVIDTVEDCNSSSCRAQLTGRQTTSTLTGTEVSGSGFVLLSLNLGTEPVCTGYTPPTTDWYEFQLTTAGDKTVDTAYDKAAVKRAGGKSALEICFAAPDAFPVKGGGDPQPFDYDGNPVNGAEGFVGLLPDCDSDGPCIDARSSTPGGGAIVTFLVPAVWGDPRYR